MPGLDRKVASVFAGKVVRKDLVRNVKVGANVPVFVLEYLLGKYCATDDAVAINAGLKVVNDTLSSNFVRSDEANKAQSMLKDKGRHTFIDKVQVRYVSEDDKHWAELKNFGHKYVHIPEHYLRDYDRLLMGEIWAQLDIRHQYDEEQKGKRSLFWIDLASMLKELRFRGVQTLKEAFDHVPNGESFGDGRLEIPDRRRHDPFSSFVRHTIAVTRIQSGSVHGLASHKTSNELSPPQWGARFRHFHPNFRCRWLARSSLFSSAHRLNRSAP